MKSTRPFIVPMLALCAAILMSASLIAAETAAKPSGGKPLPYPLTTCLVSDEALGGDMGEPVSLVDDGQEFKFCCKKCIKEFIIDPARWHQKLEAKIIETQGDTYPLTTDVVSGEALPKEPIDLVYKGQLVRFAQKESLAKFEASPDTYLSKLDAARKAKKK